MIRALAALALALLSGCTAARVQLVPRPPLQTAAGRFELASSVGDEESEQQVRLAIEKAGPRLATWGGLREGVAVQVLPSHEALEQAVDRKGYDWLRAWARYGEVYVQSPKTWGPFGAREEDVAELMLHELTHCVMYQAAGTASTWSRKGIPLWFREGMASWTAHQALRWMTLETLAESLEQLPGADPLGAPEALYRSSDGLVYAAAHHAFTYLVHTRGEDKVRAVLARMGAGDRFGEAFPSAVGLAEADFLAEFRAWLLGRKFRSVHPAPWVVKP